MSKPPFIGAIVHYVETEDHDLDDRPIRTCYAAIVTKIPASCANPGKVDLTTIEAGATASEPHTTHGENNKEMTWHWPEECLSSRKGGEE